MNKKGPENVPSPNENEITISREERLEILELTGEIWELLDQELGVTYLSLRKELNDKFTKLDRLIRQLGAEEN